MTWDPKRQDLGPQLKKIARLFRRSRALKRNERRFRCYRILSETMPVAGVILVLKAGFAVCFWSQVNKHSEFIHFTKTTVRDAFIPRPLYPSMAPYNRIQHQQARTQSHLHSKHMVELHRLYHLVSQRAFLNVAVGFVLLIREIHLLLLVALARLVIFNYTIQAAHPTWIIYRELYAVM